MQVGLTVTNIVTAEREPFAGEGTASGRGIGFVGLELQGAGDLPEQILLNFPPHSSDLQQYLGGLGFNRRQKMHFMTN